MQTPAADTQESNKRIEPLEQDSSSRLWLDKPIGNNASIVHDNYLDEGRILTATEAVSQYYYMRIGEKASVESDNKITDSLRQRDLRNYGKWLEIDRQLSEVYSNPSTALLSLRVSRDVQGRVSLIEELYRSFDKTLNSLRRWIEVEEFEWVAVFAGTEEYATPHVHLYIISDGDLNPSVFQRSVKKFARVCQYSPADGRGNDPEDGALRIMGNAENEIPRRNEDRVSAGMLYTLTQLPHIRKVENMTQAELLHSSTVRAWESGHHFRQSRYSLDEGEEEAANVTDSKLRTQGNQQPNYFSFTDYTSSFEFSVEQNFSLG
jgi:hypothetical protein